MEKHKRINITLPTAVAVELEKIAIELDDKKSRIITEALELYFDELDTKLAEQRLKNSSSNLVKAEDVWTELNI